MVRHAVVFLGLLLIQSPSFAEGSFASERAKARLYPYANDLGPDRLDVSKYPPEKQRTYNALLADKCTRCHGMARVINSEFVEPQVWQTYVKRMMIKPGADISPAQAKEMWEFLTYDAQVRKTGAQAKTWEAQRQKWLKEFRIKYPFRYKELYEAR